MILPGGLNNSALQQHFSQQYTCSRPRLLLFWNIFQATKTQHTKCTVIFSSEMFYQGSNIRLSSHSALVRSGDHSKLFKIGQFKQREVYFKDGGWEVQNQEPGRLCCCTKSLPGLQMSSFCSSSGGRESGHALNKARMSKSKPLVLLLTETNPVGSGSHFYHLTNA